MSDATAKNSRPDAGLTITTGQLAAMLGAELVGPGDLVLNDLVALEPGQPAALSYIRDAKYAAKWGASKCSAALVTKGIAVPDHDAAARALIFVDNADLALIEILRQITPPRYTPPAGVHPSAFVDPSATIADDAVIAAGAVVAPECVVQSGAVIASNCTLGRGVRIGPRSVLRPNCVIEDGCTVGADCLLHPGVVVGCDGFGYAPSPDGDGSPMIKVPHAGAVVIGDRVEIGSGTRIDRGKLTPTRIGDDCKIDNLVHIGHNAQLARGVMLCAHISVGGSAQIGDGVMAGGHTAFADHCKVGAGARIGGMSGVNRDVPAGEDWAGHPFVPIKQWMPMMVAIRALGKKRQRNQDAAAKPPKDQP